MLAVGHTLTVSDVVLPVPMAEAKGATISGEVVQAGSKRAVDDDVPTTTGATASDDERESKRLRPDDHVTSLSSTAGSACLMVPGNSLEMLAGGGGPDTDDTSIAIAADTAAAQLHFPPRSTCVHCDPLM